MKVHQILGITLATAVSILALPKEASADQASNGANLNGQGLGMNGTRVNGFSQGTNLESAKTGLTFSSPNFTAIKVEGGRLVGVK